MALKRRSKKSSAPNDAHGQWNPRSHLLGQCFGSELQLAARAASNGDRTGRRSAFVVSFAQRKTATAKTWSSRLLCKRYAGNPIRKRMNKLSHLAGLVTSVFTLLFFALGVNSAGASPSWVHVATGWIMIVAVCSAVVCLVSALFGFIRRRS